MRKQWSISLTIILALIATLATGCGGKKEAASKKKEKKQLSEEDIAGNMNTMGMGDGGGEGGGGGGEEEEMSDADIAGGAGGEGGDPTAEMMAGMGDGGGEEGAPTTGEDGGMAEMMKGMGDGGGGEGAPTTGEDGGMAEMMKGMDGGGGEGAPTTGEGGMAEMMAGMGGEGGGGGAAAAAPKTLLEAAQRAFDQGNDKDAFQYLYAAAVTKDRDGPSTLEKMRWIPGLKRPVLGVRWGLGIHYVTPKDFKGQAYPIGSKQQIAKKSSRTRSRRNRRGGGDAAGGGFPGAPGGGEGMPDMEAMAGGGGPGMEGMEGGMEGMMGGMGGGMGGGGNRTSKELEELTGDFGKGVLEALEDRMERGMYGLVLKTAAAPKKRGRAAAGGGGGGGMEAMMAGMGGGGDPAAMMAGAGGEAGGGGGGETKGSSTVQQLRPGIAMVGKGEESELLVIAAQEGIDVLAMFEVKVTKNSRNGLVLNKVNLKFLDVQKAISNVREGLIYSFPSGIDNLSVQRKRDATTTTGDKKKSKRKVVRDGDDPVDAAIDRIFAEVDRSIKISTFPPSVTEPVVRQFRITKLTASVPENPMPVLAEIKLYNTLSLLKSEVMLEAYKQVLQSPLGAAKLIQGNQDEQLQVIAAFLPELPKKGDPKRAAAANAQKGRPAAGGKKKGGGLLDTLKAAVTGGIKKGQGEANQGQEGRGGRGRGRGGEGRGGEGRGGEGRGGEGRGGRGQAATEKGEAAN